MARWEDVLHQQHLLWRQWTLPGYGLGLPIPRHDDGSDDFPLGPRIQEALLRADPVYVDSDVALVIDAALAAPSYEAQSLLADDFFTDCGFMVLPRSVAWLPEGPSVPIRAFLWEVIGRRVKVLFYSHRDDSPPSILIQAPVPERPKRLMPGLDLDYAGMREFSLGEPDDERTVDSGDFQTAITAGGQLSNRTALQYLQVALRIAGERFAVHRPQRLPRGMRRDLERKGVNREAVTVITLRRAKTLTEVSEGRAIEWSCRWLVRGHWRNQPYPSLGLGVTRRIWISGYVKGDPDKELRVTKRAFEFVR